MRLQPVPASLIKIYWGMASNCTRAARAVAVLLAALVLLPTTGCLAAGGSGQVSQTPATPPARVAPAARETVAGVPYDPSAPLDATVTRLGGQGITSYNVRYRGAKGDFVPGVLTLPAPPPGAEKPAPPPCVLLLHGLGGSKGDMFLIGLSFASRGYATLAIDIAGHGERPRIGDKPSIEMTMPEMRQACATTVIDLRRGVDFLATRPEIDAKRLGFVGLSMGGILGGVFIACEPRVRAATLWAAGGDWGTLVTTSTHAFARRFRERGATDSATIRAQMNDVDPVRYIARFTGRPLLLINGDSDLVVPRASTDALFAAARDPKRRVTLPGGHVPNLPQMMEQTLAFLNANLKGQTAAKKAGTLSARRPPLRRPGQHG